MFRAPAKDYRGYSCGEGDMADANPFVGAWQLVSWVVRRPDGSRHYPFGKDAVGYLLYTADGYMSAQIMDPDRQQHDPCLPLEPVDAQTLPEADRARAYSTYLSYCGTYAVQGDTVTHQVKAGLTPSWTGSDQPRRFRFDGRHLIILVGDHTLTWERAAPPA
jgi:hypothetical protein